MGTRVATIIIEPRLLIREALESLMANHSYRVVCGVGSTADIGSPLIVADGPKLVILGAQSSDSAVTEAHGIRKLWPDSKIILLFELASLVDFQKLLTSEIDGCVPLLVSPETLISTLDLIMIKDVRVMVVANAKRLSTDPTQADESPRPQTKLHNFQSCSTERVAMVSQCTTSGRSPNSPKRLKTWIADFCCDAGMPELYEKNLDLSIRLHSKIASRAKAGDVKMKVPVSEIAGPSVPPALRPVKKVAASSWGRAGRARSGLGRGGVGM